MNYTKSIKQIPSNFPARRRVLPVLAWGMILMACCATTALSQKYNWLDFGGNPQHDNFDRNETILTTANVGGLTQLWSINVGGPLDREPLYVHDLSTIAGTKDVVFVDTLDGKCAAYDALIGTQIWKTASLNSMAGTPGIGNRNTEANCVIDPTLQYIFVNGTDGYIYKLKTYDGSEVTTGGWPIQSYPSPKEMGYSLGIFTASNGISYLTAKNSQGLGHIVTINLSNNTRHIFTQGNTTVVDEIVTNVAGGACAWGRAAGVYDPDSDSILYATANNNGAFDPNHHCYGECVIKLKYDGTSSMANAPMDSFTPTNVNATYGTEVDGFYLDPGDHDLGSTDPLILPNGICPNFPHLMVQSGKAGWLWVINRDNLSGKGAPGHVGGELFRMKLPQNPVTAGDGCYSQPTLYVDPADQSTWVIVGSQTGICGLKFALTRGGLPTLQTVWTNVANGGNCCTATATANGLLFYNDNGLQSGTNSSTLFCVDVKTGSTLWQAAMGKHHWTSQIVASGMVFIENGGQNLIAFGGVQGSQAPTVTATPVSSSQVNLSWTTVSGATSYNVKRGTVNGGPYTTIASGVTTTSYSDTALSASTTYYYVVSAIVSGTEGPNSSQVSALTFPAAPASLTPHVLSSSSIKVDWSASSGASSYNLKSATVNGGPYTTIASGITGTAYTNSGLSASTTYYYVVSAVNGSGESTNSVQVSATTLSGGSVLLSQNMPATASSYQMTNYPANGNDGNLSTRWVASSPSMPQWWQVDLGTNRSLNQAVIDWYDASTRYYQYYISSSTDNTNFTMIVNETNNITTGNTTNNFSATGRYVRVTVTSGSQSNGYASFYECQIYGN